MTTAATTSKMGAAIAIFRRAARSCAAPLACHAAHRSSNVVDSATGVDVGVPDGATTVDTVVAMCLSRPKGFGEGWARMAEGSEKQEPPFYPIAHCLARTSADALPCQSGSGGRSVVSR